MIIHKLKLRSISKNVIRNYSLHDIKKTIEM